jgi:hypothetical protein
MSVNLPMKESGETGAIIADLRSFFMASHRSFRAAADARALLFGERCAKLGADERGSPRRLTAKNEKERNFS